MQLLDKERTTGFKDDAFSCLCCQVDPQYPGTALERLQGIHFRVKTLSTEELSGEWQARKETTYNNLCTSSIYLI